MSRARRVRPIVALTLLETLRVRDRPEEFLMQEDPSVTLPRRLGLSTVVRSQIDRYERAVKTRELLREDEVAPLVALVLRRDDARDVLESVGRRLAADCVGRLGWQRALPRALRMGEARRKVGKALRTLFPGLRTRSNRETVVLTGSDHFCIRAAPGGEACAVVGGFGVQGMKRLVGGDWDVDHDPCIGTGAAACVWTITPRSHKQNNPEETV